jgi:hypothetical protein
MEALAADRVSPPADLVTPGRVKVLATVLVVTALPASFLGLLWQGPEETNGLYTFAEISPDRDLWWGLVTAVGVLLAISVPIQALLTMLLATGRGSSWTTVGGVLMWVGAGLQAAGLGGWAAAYYFATDAAVGSAAGTAVIEAANADEAHLLGLVLAGMALVVLGTIAQSVGLFRARSVPVWVPVALLSVVLMFIVPGFGPQSLIGSVPMAVATVSIAVFAVRRVSGR